MTKKNNSKIKPWQAILLMASLFTIAIGWLFTVSAGLNNKVDEYQKEVQNYQSALTIISTRLTEIETNMDWMMKFILPPDLYYELNNPKE